MFGTLRYEPQCDGISFHAGSLLTQHSACDNCRARKLKCGGQKTGCGRCKSAGVRCVYSESSANPRRGHNGMASQAGKNCKTGTVPARIPKTRNTAVQCEPLDQVQTTLNGTRTDSRNSETMDEAAPLSANNNVFSPFASSMPPFDDESMASDFIFQDILSELSPHSNRDGFGSPDFSTQSNLGDYSSYLNDLFPISDPNSLSSETTDTINPFTPIVPIAEARPPTSITSPATQQLQTDKRSLQGSAQERDSAYAENIDVVELRSPVVDTRPTEASSQISQSQAKKVTHLLQDRSQCQGDCRCLQLTVSLLERFENRELATNPPNLDSALANHKGALDHCIRMVRCPSCSKRSDYMILLRILTDKLITSYERIVVDNKDSLQRCRLNGSDREFEDTSPTFSRGCDEGNKACRFQAMSFGCYKIEGSTEWGLIVCVLIALQLKQMCALLAHLQSVAEGVSGESQVSSFWMRKQRLQLLSGKIRKFASFLPCDLESGTRPIVVGDAKHC